MKLRELQNRRIDPGSPAAFNSRLQPTQIYLGTTSGGYDKLKLNYSYGDWVSGSIDATKNNGNIVQQVITVPTVGSHTGFTATQKYYYDSLNRIDDSTEDLIPHGGSSSQTWRQDFSYDRYGNRNFVEANTSFDGFLKECGGSMCSELKKRMNPPIGTGNRLSTSDDYAFDSAGNTTADPDDRQFIYDGENKQVKVLDDGDATIGEYWYDGDGRRVKKVGAANGPFAGETIVFVYDAFGKLIAEYSVSIETTNVKVAYVTNDHLGSPRINTDKNGGVTTRHDYHPFGEKIVTEARNEHAEYGGDKVRTQFTGYERDGETELDFAQARMYSNVLGRFASSDRIMIEMKRVLDPQGMNRYVYARNNPLEFIDPTGKTYVGKDDDEVKIKFNKDGTIKKLGKNATDDLKKMADLLNKSGSAKALSQFRKAYESQTKFHVVIHTGSKTGGPTGESGSLRAHDKEGNVLKTPYSGDAAYINDSKTGNLIYKEATINLWEYDDGSTTLGRLDMRRQIHDFPDLSPVTAQIKKT